MTRARGFTLVELMISTTLFGFVAAGALSLVMSSVRSQARAARVDVTQGGLRAGFDFMTRDLLSASTGASGGSLTLASTGATLLPINVVDSSTGPDSLDIYLVDPNVQATILATVTAATTSLSVNQTSGFAVGNWLLVSDLGNAMLVTSTALSATSLTIGSPVSLPAAITSFQPGAYVFKARHVTYAIANTLFGSTTATANGAALTLDVNDGNGPQPLAEGVEDLQIALGFDNNGDGLISEVGAAAGDDEWTYNVAGETAPATLANLKVVRVTLIAKATQAEPGLLVVRPAAEDHAQGTSSDSFLRRVIRTEIAVRNFNL